MRVLVVSRTYPPVVGGIERFSFHLASELSQICQTTLLVNRRGKKALPFFLPYAALASVVPVKRRKIELVHLCDALLAPVGLLVKKMTGAPVTATVHGLDATYANRLYQATLCRTLPKLDRIIAVSESTRQISLQRWPELAAKTTVVANGVQPPPDQPTHRLPAELEERLAGRRVLLTVGRLIKRKGVAWFIEEVLGMLPEDVCYLVVGDGPERQAVERVANSTGRAAQVVLAGRVSDAALEAVYTRADLFLMPNVSVPGDVEGFGLVALEAAARNLPVVAADLQGIPEAIHDGRNGFLIEAGRASAFAGKVQELLALSASRRAQLAKRFRDYTLETFSWQNTAAGYEREFRSLLYAAAGPRTADHARERNTVAAIAPLGTRTGWSDKY